MMKNAKHETTKRLSDSETQRQEISKQVVSSKIQKTRKTLNTKHEMLNAKRQRD
jgi:hypothetical protein